MDDAELIGGILFDAPDPIQAAALLLETVVAGSVDTGRLKTAGLEPTLVESLLRLLPQEPRALEVACAKGAGWVLGRRSVTSKGEDWEVVVSIPAGEVLPKGVRRTTGETIIGLVSGAQRSLRLAAPYIDEPGIAVLSDSVVAATLRGIRVELFEPQGWESAKVATSILTESVRCEGDMRFFRLVRTALDAPFAHLKVLVADGSSAYIGSANFTGAGLVGRNLEIGVLVRGRRVEIIDHVLDLYERPSPKM